MKVLVPVDGSEYSLKAVETACDLAKAQPFSSLILMSVGMDAVLTVLAREQAKLGLIFLDMRRAAQDLSKLI